MKETKRGTRKQTLSRMPVIVEEDRILTKRHSSLRASSDEAFYTWIRELANNGSKSALIMPSDGGAYCLTQP